MMATSRAKARVLGVGETGEVSIARVRFFVGQPRKHIEQAALKRLARSIKKVGQLNPALVKLVIGDPECDYELIGGERRYRAIKLNGGDTILVRVIGVTDRLGQLTRAAADNFNRKGCAPLEIADTFEEMKEGGLSVREIADICGMTRAGVQQYLGLLKLDKRVRALMLPTIPAKNRVKFSVALALQPLSGEHADIQYEIAEYVSRHALSTGRALLYIKKRLVKEGIETQSTRAQAASGYRVLETFLHNLRSGSTYLLEMKSRALEEMLAGMKPEDFRWIIRAMEECEENIQGLRQAFQRLYKPKEHTERTARLA